MAADPLEVAQQVSRDRYAGANLILLCGSVVSGLATAFSDLDLVVVYPNVEYAWRESFTFRTWPIEAFVHDKETLRYFFHESDRASGVPSLPRMVLDGIPIPAESDLSAALKDEANKAIEAGPPLLRCEELDQRRYQITDLVYDLRDPRSREELIASGARLYEPLADFFFRANGRWSATGKGIPRALRRDDPEAAESFAAGFDDLFMRSDPAAVIALAERLLAPHGGFLFNGFRRNSPPEWRMEQVDRRPAKQ